MRDEGSHNGVFTRIRNPVSLESGGAFLVGEQLLQVEAAAPDFGPQPDSEGTYYYASPKRASKMRLIQRLRGGDIGIIFRARGDTITIGRENNDVNFPDDPFISGHHSQVSIGADGRFTRQRPGVEERHLRAHHRGSTAAERRLCLPGAAAAAGRDGMTETVHLVSRCRGRGSC